MTEDNLKEIIDVTMQARAVRDGNRYNDWDRKIVMAHAKPFINAKPEKLIDGIEAGFRKIEGMTTKPAGMMD